jgi:hypothetical protein
VPTLFVGKKSSGLVEALGQTLYESYLKEKHRE